MEITIFKPYFFKIISMVMRNITDFQESEKVISSICKTDDEAIKSEAFLKWFETCIRRFPSYDKEYYLWIVKKAKENRPISLDEFKDLEKLSQWNAFISLANRFFSKFVNFSWTKEEYDNFKITVESMKKYLIKYVFVNVIKNSTFETLNSWWIKWIKRPSWISYYEEKWRVYVKNKDWDISDYGFIEPIFGWKYFIVWQNRNWIWFYLLDSDWNKIWLVLNNTETFVFDKIDVDNWYFIIDFESNIFVLNQDLVQISPEWEKFHQINLRFYNVWIIIVWCFVLNFNWQPIAKLNNFIYPEDNSPTKYFSEWYDFTRFLETWLFISLNLDWKWLWLFDKDWSVLWDWEKNEYEHIDLRFLEKYWVVFVFDWKKFYLLKKWEDWLFYAFKEVSSYPKDDEKWLYVNWLFWRKKYIETK